MRIKILELIDGAKKAEGLTVIIDVFRAFTLETYLFAQGAEKIYPVGEMAEAFALKEQHPDWLLADISDRRGFSSQESKIGTASCRERV